MQTFIDKKKGGGKCHIKYSNIYFIMILDPSIKNAATIAGLIANRAADGFDIHGDDREWGIRSMCVRKCITNRFWGVIKMVG